MPTVSRSPSRSARAIIFALAFALWIAGTLGVMHRSLHVPGLTQAAEAAEAAEAIEAGATGNGAQATTPGGVHKHAAHGLGSLFGEHTEAECRLYDQLEHGSAAPSVPLVVLPMLLPSTTFAFLQGEAVARWVALFDARGPPSSR